MRVVEKLVPARQRHLKWPIFDALEAVLMILCGFMLLAFSTTVMLDIVTRTIGRPWLWLQEATSTFFIYGIFIGAAAATRRNDHLYLTAVAAAPHCRMRLVGEVVLPLVVLCVALCLIWFGYLNFLRGFSSFRMPSMTPIASLYAAIPLAGILIAAFTIEQLVNGCRNGFDHQDPGAAEPASGMRLNGDARGGAAYSAVDDLPVPVPGLSGRPGCILPDGGGARWRAVHRCFAYRHCAKNLRRDGFRGPAGDPVLSLGRRTHEFRQCGGADC